MILASIKNTVMLVLVSQCIRNMGGGGGGEEEEEEETFE